MKVKIKLALGAKMPVRSTNGSAGWDLHAHIDRPIVLRSVQRALHYLSPTIVPTGVHVALPSGYYWDVRVRSGISSIYGIILVNGAGVIDEDYRGEVMLPLLNLGPHDYEIMPGERIGQAILMRYEQPNYELVAELEGTSRGIGGFGSTGRGYDR